MCEYIDKTECPSMPLLDQLVNQRWLCFLTIDMSCHLINGITSLGEWPDGQDLSVSLALWSFKFYFYCFLHDLYMFLWLWDYATPEYRRNTLMFQFHIVKLSVICDFLLRQLNYFRIIVSVSFCHMTMKKSFMVNSMSPQKLFLLSFTYSRTSRN